MRMECLAEAIASRIIVYIALLPPAGELRTTCTSRAPGLEAAPGEVFGAAERHTRRLQPVLREGALQLLDDRPFDEDIGVAPAPFLATVPAPLPADAGSTGHPEQSVHDEDPAVVPEIDAVEGERAQRPIYLDAAAGFCHRGAMLEAGCRVEIYRPQSPFA